MTTTNTTKTGDRHPGGGVFLPSLDLNDVQEAVRAILSPGIQLRGVRLLEPEGDDTFEAPDYCLLEAMVEKDGREGIIRCEKMLDRLTYSGEWVDGVFHWIG